MQNSIKLFAVEASAIHSSVLPEFSSLFTSNETESLLKYDISINLAKAQMTEQHPHAIAIKSVFLFTRSVNC